ncbi:MAG TPA: BREX-2 system adenine-specific DNA-methyltransferase PglX [Planctomycetaceae bacterium]|nr:BREX-2 system adenine-specific DNA-methyltransferase PglX [Planctomycetaceae bacterium]
MANPPYITPKDQALNQDYRNRYSSCHRRYSLSVPFMERIFRLCLRGNEVSGAGLSGQITANSFMRREFGKKLIEEFFETIDLTHVLDISGAYIPGHGTPTVILFGRNRFPITSEVRVVMANGGEPETPDDPAKGVVWTAVTEQVDQTGTNTEFATTADLLRSKLQKHPWSIGGGGATDLKERIDDAASGSLSNIIDDIGRSTHVGEDDVYFLPPDTARRIHLRDFVVPFVTGDSVRDYSLDADLVSVFPYHKSSGEPLEQIPLDMQRHFWMFRVPLRHRKDFGQTVEERGLRWFDHTMFFPSRYRTTPYLASPNIASHLHFVPSSIPSLFNMTAPVVILQSDSPEGSFEQLLAYCNSSIVCFWMKQIAHQKQLTGGDGVRVESLSKVPFQYSTTQIKKIPIPASDDESKESLWKRLSDLGKRLCFHIAELEEISPHKIIQSSFVTENNLGHLIKAVHKKRLDAHRHLVAIQEEVDFTSYCLFGLCDETVLLDPFPENLCVDEGERPFCINNQTNEDGFVVPKDIPTHWPESIKTVWRRRIECIGQSTELGILEDSMYKRRWVGRQGLFNHRRHADDLRVGLGKWLLDRLESYFDFDGRMSADAELSEEDKQKLGVSAPLREIALYSVAKLADIARQDSQFMEVAEVYRDDPAFDVERLVEELVKGEHVPLLPVLRYKPSSLRNRAEWERTWELQRLEDKLRAGEPVNLTDYDLTDKQQEELTAWQSETPDKQKADDRGLDQILSISVPPKYKSSDFISTGGARYWALRGKLDVPKERWVSFPHCEGPDGTLMIAWAGYNHLQLTQAISAYFVEVQEHLGGRDDVRLIPLLAGVIELLPWLKQWHHDIDPEFNQRMDEVYEGFVNEEARALGKTSDEIKAWQPPKKPTKKTRTKN